MGIKDAAPGMQGRVVRLATAVLAAVVLTIGLGIPAHAHPSAPATYIVKEGETLGGIAYRNKTTVAALMQLNGLSNPNSVRAGAALRLPGSATPAAAPAAAPAPAPAPAAATYVVRSGETLGGIASRNKTTVSALIQANGITNPNVIREGMTLRIPGSATTAVAGANNYAVYVVKAGETLGGIASRNKTTVRALQELNGLANPNLVREGMRLRLPGAGAPQAAPAAAPAPSGSGVAKGTYPLTLQRSPERLALVPNFQHWARTYNVPTDLLMAVAWQESGWKNHVVSSVGARGIGQIMPGTRDYIANVLIKDSTLSVADPDDNIRMSARYLRYLLDYHNGNVDKAIGSYYQGPAAVRKHGFYKETERYVSNVQSFRWRFA